MRILHRYIPERHVQSFLEEGLHFSRCDSFVDLLEFRFGYCSWRTGCESWPELRNCVEGTFKEESVNRTISNASISCWTAASNSDNWAWTVYGKDAGAIRISVEQDQLAQHVRTFGFPGYQGFVTYDFQSDEVFPPFLEPFNNPSGEQKANHHLFFHKHGFYRYEAEYRIVLFQDGPVVRPLPDQLIQSVSTSRFGPLNRELQARLTSRFGEKLR